MSDLTAVLTADDSGNRVTLRGHREVQSFLETEGAIIRTVLAASGAFWIYVGTPGAPPVLIASGSLFGEEGPDARNYGLARPDDPETPTAPEEER